LGELPEFVFDLLPGWPRPKGWSRGL
jgi:hypothetical protein